MAIKGNKGEWSEFYTMLKLLGDGVVFSADGNMNKIPRYFYPILSVIRDEEGTNYVRDSSNKQIVIYQNKNKVLDVPVINFIKMYEYLYQQIVNAKASSFEVPKAEAFMKTIKCKKLKAKSADKKDIVIKIHDLRTGMQPELGFSIKSMLGKDSTLFNYSGATNITYRVTGSVTDTDMVTINNISDQLERMDKIYELGFDLEYAYFNSKTCYNNFQLIDTVFPDIMAELVRMYFYRESNTTSVKDLVELLASNNKFNNSNKDIFYQFKMKQFLVSSALGMTAGVKWTGKYDATGGYLVVKKDGDVVCYHFYDKNEIENYLYNNTRFDNPERARCGGWGDVFKDTNGNYYITLNFQIKSKNNKQRNTKRTRAPRTP